MFAKLGKKGFWRIVRRIIRELFMNNVRLTRSGELTTLLRTDEGDGRAHLSAWLHGLASSKDLEHALGAHGRDHLAPQLDLPAAYGGVGL